ncbi:MAG: V-type ATP synthase subunit C, partial [Sarcina sp.]
MMDVMQFTQALSRIWVLETRLLDKTKIERMIETHSSDDALKILGETEYSNVMSNVKRAADYEDILSAELKRVYDLVYELCPVKEVVDLMGIKYEYHNLKSILKGKFLGKDFSYMFINLGRDDVNELKRKIDGENYSQLRTWMEKAVEAAVADFEVTKDPQQIDIILDRYMFKEMVEIKKGLNYGFIDKYVNALIDLNNVRTLLRIKKQNKGRDFANEVMIEGGAISKDTIVAMLNESPEGIISRLNSSNYSDV